jgi:VWFA-related protein
MRAPAVSRKRLSARSWNRLASLATWFLVAGTLSAAPAQAPATNPPAQPPASAAADKNAPEMSTHDTPATFSTKVNLVSVPVVVRDGKGHAIGTLQKEDFQLFDKGKPQIITKFSVEKAGEPSIPVEVATDAAAPDKALPAPSIATHFVAYLFDDVHMDAGDLLRTRNATDRHIAESLEPSSRAAIFTTSGQVTVDFTDDRDQLHQALLRILPRAGAVSVAATCPDMDYYVADLVVNKHDPLALAALASEAMACIAAPAGNTPQAQQQALQQAAQAAESAAMQMLNMGERDTRLPLIVLRDVIRRMSAAPGSRTLLILSPGFFLTSELRQDETEIIDRAIRANIVISALDVRGLFAAIPGGDASQPGRSTAMQRYLQDSALASADIMAELADGTGGTFFQNNNDLKEGFTRVADQPEYRYLLGFSPQNLKLDGSYHALKVTLKSSKGLDLQARRGYYAPKHLADPEEEAKQQLQEALYSRDEIQDIPVELHMQFFKSSDEKANLAVLARVEVKNLRFRKADGRNNDNLTILSGIFDRNGNYINAIEKVVEMRLRDQTLEKVLTSGITVRTNFDVTPGSYVVRLVVRDSEGQTMAARNGAVQIP